MHSKYVILSLILAGIGVVGYFGWKAFKGGDCCDLICTSSKSCTIPAAGIAKNLEDYSEEDLKVINYAADLIQKYDGNLSKAMQHLDPAQVAAELKIDPDGNYLQHLEPGIRTALAERNVDLDRVAATSNCVKFAACSVDQKLAAAAGEELERYTMEKAEDGKFYTDWQAPDFQFRAPDGSVHSLSDYKGQKVALMLFALHCNHCYATIPMISELHKEFETDELKIIPVYVNKKGMVKDETIKYLNKEFGLRFDLMVSLNKNVGDLFDARMVPSTFLIDETGYITRKFVGQKDKLALAEAFGTFVKG